MPEDDKQNKYVTVSNHDSDRNIKSSESTNRKGLFDILRSGEKLGVSTDWKSVRESQRLSRLLQISEEFSRNLEDIERRADTLAKISTFRLLRYNTLRIIILCIMVFALSATIYANQSLSIGYDLLLARLTPVLISSAILFYSIQGFLKDHEVALKTGKAADVLKIKAKISRNYWVAYVSNDDTSPENMAAAQELLLAIGHDKSEMEEIISSEKALSPPDISKMIKETALLLSSEKRNKGRNIDL